jgi:hypothetical protein
MLRPCATVGALTLMLAVAHAEPGPAPDPRKGERYDGRTRGRIKASEVALAVPRILLTPPRLIVGLIGQGARGVLQLDHRYHLATKLAALFVSEDRLVGLAPILRYYSNFTPMGGFSIFDKRSMGPRSRLEASIVVGLPQLILADVAIRPPLPERYRLQLDGHYVRRSDLLFVGIGPSSFGGARPNHDARARYGIDSVDVPLSFDARVHRWLHLSLTTTYAWRRYRDGRALGDDDPISTVYCRRGVNDGPEGCRVAGIDEDQVPSFHSDASFISTEAGLSFDTRKTDAAPSRGLRLEAGARYAHGIRDGSQWLDVRGALTGVIPLGGPTRVLVLRASTELLAPFGETPVPFTELVTLGGADSLRGFPAGRFRDYSSLMFTAEYRWTVWLAADAAVFADWGGVFDRNFGGFAIDRMVPDVGVGLRIRTQSSFLVRLQLAYGFGEGIQLVLATNTGL